MIESLVEEDIIEPDLVIVDPHHHLWFIPEATTKAMRPEGNPFHHVRTKTSRYLLDEVLRDLRSGHNVVATVYAQCHSMYRSTGPEAEKSIGEVEFANGIAAMAESGAFGPTKVCAGIIGHVDLTTGDGAYELLQAHIRAGGGRFCGVRYHTNHDPDPEYRNCIAPRPGMLAEDNFRRGFRYLRQLDLTFDAYVFEPQIGDVTDLARAFPDTQLVLDHVGSPLGLGQYAHVRKERFANWRDSILELARCENVTIKLGGLGMAICGFPTFLASAPATSEQLAKDWAPYMETCITAFGTQRCMFESNFPTESGTCTYPVLWNAFKRIAAGASSSEKDDLFSRTADRVYNLDLFVAEKVIDRAGPHSLAGQS